MAKVQLNLEIITQEKHLLTQSVDQVSAPAVTGEITVMPNHMPLFTKLQDGIVRVFLKKETIEYAITGGFMDIAPGNKVTILADSGIRAQDINIAKAEEAKIKAQQAMDSKQSEIEFKQAEASLRKALIELKVARRQKAKQSPTIQS